MKKLLAMILCVMLFVAVIPTAAFAVTIPSMAVPTTSGKYVPGWRSQLAAEKAIDAASDNIEALYLTLAADKGVFAVVSAIDGVVTGISDEIWGDVDEVSIGTALQKKLGTDPKVTGEFMNDVTKFYLRTVIGNEIMNYMNKHWGAYATHAAVRDITTGEVVGTATKIDPAKYMKTFADAACKAVGSDKAIANIQGVILSLAAGKAYDDFLDNLDDLRDEVTAWNDGDGAAIWATYFDDNGSLTGQWVQPWIDGGDLWMDPFALIEPARPYDGVDTSKYFDVDVVGRDVVFPES